MTAPAAVAPVPSPTDGDRTIFLAAEESRRVGDAVLCPSDYALEEWIAVNGTGAS